MRELKFRVWSERQKTYNYKHPYNTLGNFYINQNGCLFSDYGNTVAPEIRQKDFVIEQYTGLKDKNGKEIYEGDIMSDKSIVRFAYDNEVGSCGCCVDEFWGSGFIVSNANPIESLEVVGNIHENPELLEEK